jgi:hypothetical protein
MEPMKTVRAWDLRVYCRSVKSSFSDRAWVRTSDFTLLNEFPAMIVSTSTSTVALDGGTSCCNNRSPHQKAIRTCQEELHDNLSEDEE